MDAATVLSLLGRARSWCARHPWLRWSAVAIAATATGAVVTSGISDLRTAQSAWGETMEVVVAERHLPRGTTIGPGDVSVRPWPQALVPGEALSDLPAGLVVWQQVAPGEVLVEHDVADPTDLAARLPPGTSGISVPVRVLPVAVGALVDVVVDGRFGARGVVIEVLEADVVGPVAVVAVPEDDAPPLATAAAEGRAVLVLSASPSPPPPG